MFLRCVTQDMAAILNSEVIGYLPKDAYTWQEGLLLLCIPATGCRLIWTFLRRWTLTVLRHEDWEATRVFFERFVKFS